MTEENSLRGQRRLSFGAVAEQYDRYRPSYPAQLVEDVIAYAGAEPGDRALEVGAGTGKATLLFTAAGLEVTALEPDPGMVNVATRRAASAGLEVEFISSDFEDAFHHHDLPEHAFKLLFSATAWHWVDPRLRNALAARALASGGALAPFWNSPLWEESSVRQALEQVYSELEAQFGVRPTGPMTPVGEAAESQTTRDWIDREFGQDDHFTDVQFTSYRTPFSYTAAEYVKLVGTHSDHMLLEPKVREHLFRGVGEAIDAAGGSFELTYETLLCLARRV